MPDPVSQERRRLSAAWLNIIAAGLASAGLAPLLDQLAVRGWGSATGDLLAAALTCAGVSCGLHVLARRLLRAP